jgi:dihydroneopterin aldolase
MHALMVIELKKLKIFGFHGLLAGEEIIGGEFEVNLRVSYVPPQQVIKKIEDTIDYTVLLELVKRRMEAATHLLETLATEICSEIIAKFSTVTAVDISIYKLHPPIINFEGSVGVTYTINRQ